MERRISQLLILALFAATLCKAQLDSVADTLRDYRLVNEPTASDFLLRQKRDTVDDDDEGTELCPGQQLKVVAERHDECNSKAESTLNQALNSDQEFDVFSVVCQVIRSKVGCINTHAPSCLKPEGVNAMRYNFLDREAEKARNSSSLGQAFISSCPELRDYQNDLVQIIYGTDKCTYAQGLSIKSTLDQCQNRTKLNFLRKRDLVLDFLQSSSKDERLNKLYQTYCELQSSWYSCLQQTVFRCMSQDKIKARIKEEQEGFLEIESDLRAKGLDSFSFNDCPKYRKN